VALFTDWEFTTTKFLADIERVLLGRLDDGDAAVNKKLLFTSLADTDRTALNLCLGRGGEAAAAAAASAASTDIASSRPIIFV
jgi:hypothetical protein